MRHFENHSLTQSSPLKTQAACKLLNFPSKTLLITALFLQFSTLNRPTFPSLFRFPSIWWITMGSLGGEDDAEIRTIKNDPIPDSGPIHTQPFDTQILSSPLHGAKGEDAECLKFIQSPLPFEGSLPVDDAFETQVLNLGGETQLLGDFDFPEYLDTQLMDEFDNQVILDSDDEGTVRTEVLSDSEDEVGTTDKCKSLEETAVQRASPIIHNEKPPMDKTDSLIDGEHSSGLNVFSEAPGDRVCPERKHGSAPRFASLRVESLRASARSIALKGTKNRSCSLTSTAHFAEQDEIKNNEPKTKYLEEHPVADTGGYADDGTKSFRESNQCKIGCLTMRKLFYEDSTFENEQLPCNSDDTVVGEEGPQPDFDGGLVGLSYIGSQEPGELSQANALAFVEKLIDENNDLLDLEVDPRKNTGVKSNHISSAKVIQLLARKTNDRGNNGKSVIFDWDDDCEDEGGGDIFRRKKEEFFGIENREHRSYKKHKKFNGDQLDGCRDNELQLDECRDNKLKTNVQNEIVVKFDSKIVSPSLLLRNKAGQEANMNARKNSVNELDEQANEDISVGHLDDTHSGKDMAEMLDVGLDTQIAAEAMEALFNGEGNASHDSNMAHLGVSDNCKGSMKCSSNNNCCIGVATRLSKRTKRMSAKSGQISPVASKKHPDNIEEYHTELALSQKGAEKRVACRTTLSKRTKSTGSKYGQICTFSPKMHPDNVEIECHTEQVVTRKGAGKSVQEESAPFTPVARRTRKSFVVSQLKSSENAPDCVDEKNSAMEVGGLEQNKGDAMGFETSHASSGGGKLIISNSISYPRRRRSLRNLSAGISKSHDPSGNIVSVRGRKRAQSNAQITGSVLNMKRQTQPSTSTCPDTSSAHQNLEERSPLIADRRDLNDSSCCIFVSKKRKNMPKDLLDTEPMALSDRKSDADSSPLSNKVNASSDTSPKGTPKQSELASTPPVNCITPVNDASPICMGNGYLTQSCKKNLSRSGLMREINGLCAERPEPISVRKHSRKRRDLANVRVLFSHHLDEDIIKQQKKIVDRLKASVASSILDATHFITDKFVRTRNMLEAIASGKPVVTHQWLEDVGRANYYIDEEKYILRDSKKEKELGFNMPVSLEHARQHPLLQGQRVFITPNSKPGKEIISSLVKAVHGQAIERVGRYALKDDRVPDDLLILSCEEDYDVCVPFLEKGAAVYNSELLLNGIVIQKLEYERHRLFMDHVKRTRSTIWLKKDSNKFVPVTNK